MDSPAVSNAMQRAKGCVRITAKRRGEETVLDRLFQSGSGKARLPNGAGFEAVLLNTAGGVTGGDLFENTIEAAADTAVTITTQTAERIYRSTGDEGRINNALSVHHGACLHWLPQETIFFDHARLRRTLSVDMAEDATILAVEPLVLGRAAMGEAVRDGFFSDQWRVRRGGRLIYADALRLNGDIQDVTKATASLGGATTCASLLYISPDAEDRIEAVRAALGEAGAASAFNGLISARIIADSSAALRTVLLRAVSVLRSDSLPRVWFS